MLLEYAGIPPEHIFELSGIEAEHRPIWRFGGKRYGGRGPTEVYSEITGKETFPQYSHKVRIVRDKEKIQQAKNLIHDMKLIGREVGERLKKQLDTEKKIAEIREQVNPVRKGGLSNGVKEKNTEKQNNQK